MEDYVRAFEIAREAGLGITIHAGELTGWETVQAALDHIRPHGRIIMCGAISEYNVKGAGLARIFRIVSHKVRMQGFIVSDHLARMGDFVRDCGGWLREGQLKYREDIVEGLERAPEAFIGLLQGQNFGKLLVRVGEDPTR